jgi:hypothetical protein
MSNSNKLNKKLINNQKYFFLFEDPEESYLTIVQLDASLILLLDYFILFSSIG